MTSTSFSIHLKSRPYRRVGSLFTIGGAFWLLYCIIPLFMGLTTGEASMKGALGLMNVSCFAIAILCFCLGLDGLALSLRRYAFGFASISLVFTCIAATSITIGWIIAVTTGTPLGVWGGIGVVGTCFSTTFAALSARKNGDIPKPVAKGLLVIGLLTLPLIIGFIWPSQFVPSYLTSGLPFALPGAAFIAIGNVIQKL